MLQNVGKKMDERMIRKHKRKYKSDVFAMKEVVLVRLGSKRRGKGAPKGRYVVKGKILKISSWSENYKLSVIRAGETNPTEIWTSIENIAKIKSNPKDNKKSSRSRFLIPLTKNDGPNMIKNQGYELIFDPPGDGSCQFSALTYFLRAFGYQISSSMLRNQVVEYLQNHWTNEEGQAYELFVGIPWSEYLNELLSDKRYGDQTTLNAVAHLYNVCIRVI